jgi:hypothetical protein
MHFDPRRLEHYPIRADDGTHVADVAVVWAGYDEERGEPIASPVNALLVGQAPEMAALLRGLLELWPLAGHELEAYVAHTLVPAARRALSAVQGTTEENRIPAGLQ